VTWADISTVRFQSVFLCSTVLGICGSAASFKHGVCISKL